MELKSTENWTSPMIKRIAHIGVVVRNLKLSETLFTKLLGKTANHTGFVEQQMAHLSFYPIGESSIELIESTRPAESGSSMAKFIEKRGEGIHHICLEVDDIRSEMIRLKGLGFQFVEDRPSPGGVGCIVAFIHPKSANGVLIELSQRV